MSQWNNVCKLLISVFLYGMLVGCTSIPLQPGAENINVTRGPVPKHCKMVGKVFADDISGITVAYTSKANLKQLQLNSLKNQALKLGANLVVVTAHTSNDGSPSYIISTGNFVNDPNEYSSETSGIAYRCP